jgi:hypothetical protein
VPHPARFVHALRVDMMGELPSTFLEVPFVAEMIPGYRAELGLTAGGNCQRFAYAVLRHFGFAVPAFRSSDLWLDEEFTVTVAEPEPLDLVLYAANPDPFGAHVGVCVGGIAVLHLCEEVGLPAVWTFEDFAARDHYKSRIGFKRVRR